MVATACFKDLGVWTLVYHGTKIMQWDENKIRLTRKDREGTIWDRATVRKRFNEFSEIHELGLRVFVKNKVWYVTHNDITVPFKDGMILNR